MSKEYKPHSVKNAIAVCVLEPHKPDSPLCEIWLLARPDSSPVIGYKFEAFENEPEHFGPVFCYQFDRPDDFHYIAPENPWRQKWVKAVDTWLRESWNDCLRARGDRRWQAACSFHQQVQAS